MKLLPLIALLLAGCRHSLPPDGPDTPQKWDPVHGYNFGT